MKNKRKGNSRNGGKPKYKENPKYRNNPLSGSKPRKNYRDNLWSWRDKRENHKSGGHPKYEINHPISTIPTENHPIRFTLPKDHTRSPTDLSTFNKTTHQ